MTTFLTSALLHGFNFKIWAVLLSLGLFAYVEEILRDKLAAIFDASIRAQRRPEDNFRHGESSFRVMLFNMLFVMLNMTLLSYCGYIYNLIEQVEGYQ